MRHTSKWLFIFVSMTALSLASFGSALAQNTDESLIPVCVDGYFEIPLQVQYLTQTEIDEINALEQDPSEPPVAEIVGYPDPETGSCFTENGELNDYDPELSTAICVPSGPDGNGTLIVRLVSNRFLPGYSDVILADPVTGECPGGDANAALVESLVETLIDILREILG